MRTLIPSLAACVAVVAGCVDSSPLAPPIPHDTPAPADPWVGVAEVIVEERQPIYDYPDDFNEVPTGEPQTWKGRWAVDFEGSIFQDYGSGEFFVTTGVDDPLRQYVRIGDSYYDWAGCLEVTIEAAVSELPSPFLGGGPWLVVREALSVKEVPGRQQFGDDCLDFQADERRITIP